MKHKLIFFVAVLMVLLSVMSCGGAGQEVVHSQPKPPPTQFERVAAGIYSFEYDGCTYIKYVGQIIIHHAGCSNPKHVCK